MSRLPINPQTMQQLQEFARTHGNPVKGEIPAGAVDGVNVTFTLNNVPRDGSLQLYSDGLRVPGTGYTTAMAGVPALFTITMAAAPATSLVADYYA